MANTPFRNRHSPDLSNSASVPVKRTSPILLKRNEQDRKNEMSSLSDLVNQRIEALRPKLLDTTRRNPLINNQISARTASYISIVDEKPQAIVDCLSNEVPMKITPLPPLDDDDLPDEQTVEFKTAFENAQQIDEDYLKAISELDFEHDPLAFEKQAQLERDLKDKIRAQLGLPARPEGSKHQDLVNHARIHGIDPSITLPSATFQAADDRHEDQELQTFLLPETLHARLSKVFNKQRVFQEERGLKVTYITVGYLRWTMPDMPGDQDVFKSPLILIPVELKRERSKEGERYTVEKIAEPHLNPVLQQKLEADAKLDLHQLQEFLESETIDVEQLFELVASLKPKRVKAWEIKREATLGIYPFQGIDLYHDLRGDGTDFSKFGVLKELMVGKDRGGEEAFDWSVMELDSPEAQKKVPHLVLDADSSQLLALMKVESGENVALEGPPGSGKSQTIVNAIASALHSGKRVLFVAQKMTALDVVYARLQALGLSNFVLPLVGAKGDTQAFYEALEDRMEMGRKRSPQQLDTLRCQLEQQRTTISSYIDLIKSDIGNSQITVHELMGLSAKHHDDVQGLPLSMKNLDLNLSKYSPTFNLSDFNSCVSLVCRSANELENSSVPPSSPWAYANLKQLDYRLLNDVMTRGQTVCQRLDQWLSPLSSELQEELEAIIDNHNVWEIEKIIALGAKWHASDDSHWRQLLANKDSSQDALKKIAAQINALDNLPETASLSGSALERIEENLGKLETLLCYISLNEMVDLEESNVSTLLQQNKDDLDRMQDISEHVSRLRRSNLLLPPKQHLDAAATLPVFKSHPWVSDVLAKASPQDLANDLHQAHKLLVNLYEILDPGCPVPNLRTARKIKATIESTGFFGRLGNSYKKALQTAREWLGYSTADKVKREAIVTDLEGVVDDIRALSKVSFFDQLDFVDSSSKTDVSDLQLALTKAIDDCRAAGLSDSQLGKFIADHSAEALGTFLQDCTELGRDWTFVDQALEVATTKAEFATQNLMDIIEASAICNSEGIKTTSLIEQAIAAGNEARDLKNRINSAAVDLGLGDKPPSKSAVNDYLELIEEAERSHPMLVDCCLSIEDSEVKSQLVTVLPVAKEIEDLYSTLIKGKGRELERRSIFAAKKEIDAHLKDTGAFNNLVARRNTISSAEECGFGDLMTLMEEENLLSEAEEIGPAALVQHLTNQTQKQFGSELLGYSGTSLDAARSKLKDIDRQLIELAPRAVAAETISQSQPPAGIGHGRKSEYTDLALLKHELSKTRRIPPRKLLKRARSALVELFPCWMMVPGAVAQHLPREELFDLVIIDEASQMQPEQSISALMRAKKALISGDTNQLPPSNFFQGLSADEDADEDIQTTEESILELANSQFHPKHRLQWHYRSKHEELIAFSNHYIYDNELIIFPSPDQHRKSMGVSLVQVNGTFQRGINPAEAQVMVEHIVKFMKSDRERSLGVVVMNQSQMEQIDAMILREAELDSQVAEYIDQWAAKDEGLNRFFVKNLENVQGDERDVIFIGTTYGCDPTGKFYQRFGPINGPSGKRRLNVLFSRAKEQIVTFSSIPVEKFQPSDTNEGAKLLKLWLQFAATKRLGESLAYSGRGGVPDSPFEEHVISAIESIGYQPVPQVGVSGYYIDIGVKHPDYPMGYICGVECDGASYHSAKNARDRDRLRQEVLERLGWDLHRIWSTDWFRDPYGQTQRMRDVLDRLLEKRLADLPALESPSLGESAHEATESLQADSTLTHNRFMEVADAYEVAEEEPKHLDSAPDSERRDIRRQVVNVGSKIELRYLDGARAGITARFWLTDLPDTDSYSVPGFTTLRTESPLGKALIEACVGDIVSYPLQDGVVRVEILQELSPSTSESTLPSLRCGGH